MSSPQGGASHPSSLHGLVATFDDLHLSQSHQAGIAGGFKPLPHSTTAHARDARPEKALPLTPHDDDRRVIPPSLRPGYQERITQPTSPARPPISDHAALPTPTVQMPIPMLPIPLPHTERSRTMAYARSAAPDLNRYNQFLSAPQPDRGQRPETFRHGYHSSVPSTTVSSPSPAKSQVSTHPRPSSTPPSPSDSKSHNTAIQCHGMTKSGKRCTRLVKAPPLVSFFAPTASEPVERFCFQHVREVLSQSGFYSRRPGVGWVEFTDWIPSYLHPDTRAALKVEMEKPASSKDEPGYIYAYEIRDDRTTGEIKIKVGRAVKLVKRLDQWSKQCTSKEVILRGWWPGTVEDDNGENGTSLLRGRVKAGEKGPLCHRLERLVHIELADLAVHAPYLEPGFPNSTKVDASSASSPSQPSKPGKVRLPGKPCDDCGAIHKEIFRFRRVPKGRYKGMEWEQIVQPVIAKWGRYVDKYVEP